MDGLRISQLADRAGVSTSTVRYYERIGLVPMPNRTPSGYREYDPQAEARLLFITRGKRMGLSLEEIAELMAIWDGTNCGATKDRLVALLDAKRAEIAEQIRELRSFEKQLADVQRTVAGSPTPSTCDTDLECCAPELHDVSVTLPIPLQVRGSKGDLVDEPIPIACTLTGGERPAREAAFSTLLADVVGWERTLRSLTLRFSPTAAAESQVKTLTAQESACCTFLTFRVRHENDQLIWEITAPSDEAALMIDEFAALLPARPRSTGTGAQ
jgi:DNA-binding transcriptional MerR regulator